MTKNWSHKQVDLKIKMRGGAQQASKQASKHHQTLSSPAQISPGDVVT
jgi:hypothetical protein